MSFKAIITTSENQLVWRRTIQMLATLHDDIRFTITPRELIVWSMNSTDTSMCQVSFAKGFFEEYTFEPENIVFGEDGLQLVQDFNQDTHKLYSFKTNGRHLSILFRKPENDVMKDIVLLINNTEVCPETLANRLQIVIHTESMLIKEYAPSFIPIKFDPIVINLRYKRKFLNVYGTSSENQEEQLDPRLLDIFESAAKEVSNSYFNNDIVTNLRPNSELTLEDEINYLCCTNMLLKNFIDSCNSSATEEVKLEINVNRLCITAFTRGIYSKNNDVLRNAMRASNTVSTMDLEHYCLFTTAEDENTNHPSTKVVTFKMKDFRSFINLSSVWKTDMNIHLWFCHPGDPILMEMRKSNVCIELVQVSDAEQGNVIAPSKSFGPSKGSPLRETATKKLLSPRKSPLKKRSPLKGQLRNAPMSPLKPTALFVKDADADADVNVRWKNPIRGKKPVEESAEETSRPASQSNDSQLLATAERTRTTIGWGSKSADPAHMPSDSHLNRRDVLKREKIRYLQELSSKKPRVESQGNSDEEQFGPTQVDKPKGIFD